MPIHSTTYINCMYQCLLHTIYYSKDIAHHTIVSSNMLPCYWTNNITIGRVIKVINIGTQLEHHRGTGEQACVLNDLHVTIFSTVFVKWICFVAGSNLS